MQLHWVPGHCDNERNEKADEETKKAARGLSSDTKLLPSFLRKRLPASISALRQNHKQALQRTWKRRWKRSPRYLLHRSIDKSAPLNKFLTLIQGLNRRQASIMTQLRTGHTSLNHHLFRIRKVESPICPHCRGITVETVKHLLVECPFYRREQHHLQQKLWRNATSVSFLLSNPTASEHLLKFVHSTG